MKVVISPYFIIPIIGIYSNGSINDKYMQK